MGWPTLPADLKLVRVFREIKDAERRVSLWHAFLPQKFP